MHTTSPPILCCALLLIGGASAQDRSNCRSFTQSIAATRHYIGWSSHWLDSSVPETRDLTLKIYKDGECTRLGIPAMDLTVYWCPGRVEELSAASCSFEQNGEGVCLGNPSVPGAQIRACSLATAAIKPWEPSGASQAKHRIVEAVRDYIATYASAEGTVISAVCDDFDVRDPSVFVLATVKAPGGKMKRLLFRLKINTKLAPYCWGENMFYEGGSRDNGLVAALAAKIMAKPIPVPLAGARKWQDRPGARG